MEWPSAHTCLYNYISLAFNNFEAQIVVAGVYTFIAVDLFLDQNSTCNHRIFLVSVIDAD